MELTGRVCFGKQKERTAIETFVICNFAAISRRNKGTSLVPRPCPTHLLSKAVWKFSSRDGTITLLGEWLSTWVSTSHNAILPTSDNELMRLQKVVQYLPISNYVDANLLKVQMHCVVVITFYFFLPLSHCNVVPAEYTSLSSIMAGRSSKTERHCSKEEGPKKYFPSQASHK